MSNAIMYISLLLLATSFLAVEWRILSAAVHTYQVQSVLIALVFALYAHSLRNEALYFWAATVLISKGVLIPWLLRRYLLKIYAKETPPLLSAVHSHIIGLLIVLFTFHWVFAHHDQLVILPSLTGEPFRMNLAVATSILIMGLYALVTRTDAFKIVIGLCLVENGVHLSLVSLAPSIPETALIGVVTDVVISVWMLLYIVAGVYRSTGSIDTLKLSQLRG
jgi:hydrogenase-4 component E